MTTLKIEKRDGKESGFYNPRIHDGYQMIISFPDDTHLKFCYIVPRVHQADDCFTIYPRFFMIQHKHGNFAQYGLTWNNFPSPLICTENGKITFSLQESTLELSPSLTEQLLDELKRIDS